MTRPAGTYRRRRVWVIEFPRDSSKRFAKLRKSRDETGLKFRLECLIEAYLCALVGQLLFLLFTRLTFKARRTSAVTAPLATETVLTFVLALLLAALGFVHQACNASYSAIAHSSHSRATLRSVPINSPNSVFTTPVLAGQFSWACRFFLCAQDSTGHDIPPPVISLKIDEPEWD
jgi:hypothetical protein